MVRMVTIYKPVLGEHGVMHVEESRVGKFLEDGWQTEAPAEKTPEPSKPAPKRRKPRGTESDR